MSHESGRMPDPGGSSTGASLDPPEFAARFQACSRTLWYVAAGVVGNRTLADDVLQEAAMIALQKLDQFDPDTNFLAWMVRIVRYTALNHGRKRQRRQERGGDMMDVQVVRTDGQMTMPITSAGQLPRDQQAFDDRVQSALEHLDPTARACLLMRVLANMPYAEIAIALDIPEGTAMSHVHRSRAALRESLAASHEPPLNKEASHG